MPINRTIVPVKIKYDGYIALKDIAKAKTTTKPKQIINIY